MAGRPRQRRKKGNRRELGASSFIVPRPRTGGRAAEEGAAFPPGRRLRAAGQGGLVSRVQGQPGSPGRWSQERVRPPAALRLGLVPACRSEGSGAPARPPEGP